MRIVNLENNNRKIISTINNFHVLEYQRISYERYR